MTYQELMNFWSTTGLTDFYNHEHDEKGRFTEEGTPATKPEPGQPSDVLKIYGTSYTKDSARAAVAAIESVHGLPKELYRPVMFHEFSGHEGLWGEYTVTPENKPKEISVNSLGSHLELTTTHEFGHYVDHQFYINRNDVLPTIKASFDYKQLESEKGHEMGYVDYLLNDKETFARAYAQYVATRSGNEKLQGQVESIRNEFGAKHNSQWDAKDFEPIAEAFDKAFQDKGLLKSSKQAINAAADRTPVLASAAEQLEFANQCHDPANGQFCENGEGISPTWDKAIAKATPSPEGYGAHWILKNGDYANAHGLHSSVFANPNKASVKDYQEFAKQTGATRIYVGDDNLEISVMHPMTKDQIDSIVGQAKPYVAIEATKPDGSNYTEDIHVNPDNFKELENALNRANQAVKGREVTRPRTSFANQCHDENGRFCETGGGQASTNNGATPKEIKEITIPKGLTGLEVIDHVTKALGQDQTTNPETNPERYAPNKGFGFHLKEGETQTRTSKDADNNPILQDLTAVPFKSLGDRRMVTGDPNVDMMLPHVVTAERPLPYVFRVVSEDEYQGILKNGYIKSDQRMNLADEGTVASADSTGSFYMVPGENRVLRIKQRAEDGWKVDPADEYIKTHQKVPASQIDLVTPPITMDNNRQIVDSAVVASANLEFANPCHDAKGEFCETTGGAVVARASDVEQKLALKKARAKIKAASVPSREEVIKHRAALLKAEQEGTRAGGEFRGNSTDRKHRQLALWKEFGGEEKGFVTDAATGVKMHWTKDPKLNPSHLPTFTQGKIWTGHQGGSYRLEWLIPELLQSNQARGDTPVRKENLD